MTAVLRALRGATTVDHDTVEQVSSRVQELVGEMLERNGVGHEEIVSILFTATDDVVSMFPATAARSLGLGDVPLICAREPRSIRVLMHCYTDRGRPELHHVYLEGARGLRDDLPE